MNLRYLASVAVTRADGLEWGGLVEFVYSAENNLDLFQTAMKEWSKHTGDAYQNGMCENVLTVRIIERPDGE